MWVGGLPPVLEVSGGPRSERAARARPTFLRAALVMIALAAAACPAPEEGVDARAFVNEIFDASVVCFPSFLAEAEPVFLRAQALAQIDAAVATFNRQIADPNVEFSRAAYDRCFDVARARDCDLLQGDESPCTSVFVGRLSDGDVCAENVQCASTLSCVQEQAACGVCRPIAILGESCADNNCTSGTFCDDNELCRTQPDSIVFDVGTQCSAAQGCGGLSAGLVCVIEPNQPTGTCAPVTIVDEGDVCELGLGADQYCRNSSSTHLCTTNPAGNQGLLCSKRPGVGEPCNSVGACDSTVAICVDGACVDEGGIPGNACTNGFGCRRESICQQQVCTALNDIPTPPSCE